MPGAPGYLGSPGIPGAELAGAGEAAWASGQVLSWRGILGTACCWSPVRQSQGALSSWLGEPPPTPQSLGGGSWEVPELLLSFCDPVYVKSLPRIAKRTFKN